MTIENLTFLEEGEFTKFGEQSNKISERIEKSNDIIYEIRKYVSSLKFNDKNKSILFRKRSGEEVLESGFSTGCTDYALAFLVLSRKLKIPAIFVESFNEAWLNSKNPHQIQGHVFVDVCLNDLWHKFNPCNGFCGENYHIQSNRYIVAGKGLDQSQIFLYKNGIYQPNPVRTDDIPKIIDVAKLINRNNGEEK
jgi:transglutaminase-like putative cysteine protease